jgi:hypothetical protein
MLQKGDTIVMAMVPCNKIPRELHMGGMSWQHQATRSSMHDVKSMRCQNTDEIEMNPSQKHRKDKSSFTTKVSNIA